MEFEMRNAECVMRKSGVSLITVLLFMLVATIAATATYKWISSEGHSSASRMLEREAYQSSIAGIENARSWMTYNANDFGALVSQYFQSGKKAVLMTPVLQSALNSKGQNYNVWLTGVEVNEDNGMYRVQILSAGEARGGARHSEVAIFDVFGLYRVNVPVKHETTKSTINFNFAYYGGTIGGTSNTMTSTVINGNWSGNPPRTDSNWIVTGTVNLSGDAVKVGKTTCIGGAANIENNGLEGKDAYFASSFVGALNMTGSVYFGGNATQNSASVSGKTYNFTIGENVTLKGLLQTNQSGGNYGDSIYGNFCFDSTAAKIRFGGTSANFVVKGNVWKPVPLPFNNISYNSVILGDSSTSKVYSSDVKAFSSYSTYRTAIGEQGEMQWNGKINYKSYYPYKQETNPNNDKYFFDINPINVEFKNKYQSTDGNYYSNYYLNDRVLADRTYDERDPHITGLNPENSSHACGIYNSWNTSGYYTRNETVSGYKVLFPECSVSWFKSSGLASPTSDDPDFDCAESVYEDCEAIWDPGTGCNGSSYVVEDPLKTAIDKFDDYANTFTDICDGDFTLWSSALISDANTCYNTLYKNATYRRQYLYNDYMVIRVNQEPENHNGFSGNLRGKFIIISDVQIHAQQGIPSTENYEGKKSFVMLYLNQGAIDLAQGYSGLIDHVFIYSAGNTQADHLQGTSKIKLHGTLYSPAVKCDSIRMENAELTLDTALLNDLANAAVICDKSVASCGGTVGSSSSTVSGSSSSTSIETADTYFIATAPQLGVTLESQYESRDNAPSAAAENLSPSLLVMPRVIYLPTNPVGKLEDYYNVISLNDVSLAPDEIEVKTPSKVSCVAPAGGTNINATGALYDDDPLTTGVHTCTYTSGNTAYANSGNVDFYVVVEGTVASNPAVYFSTPSTELISGGSVPINLTIPEVSHGQFEVDVSVTTLPTGWHLTPAAGTALRSGNVYKVTVNANAASAKIFDVSADNDASAGTVVFQLVSPCSGCTIGNQDVESVIMTGSAVVNRYGLSTYCQDFSTSCDGTNNYATYANRPDCETSEPWVVASCTGSSTLQTNDSWRCGTNSAITLEDLTIPSGCELFLPTDNNTVSAPQNNGTYKLYASLKRIPYTLTIQRQGASTSATKVNVFVSETNTFGNTADFSCDQSECSYSVYYGQYVKLTYTVSGDDGFSYWYSTSANSPISDRLHADSFTLQQISADNTVLAQFNAKDLHCFYEDFSNLSAFCNSSVDCIVGCTADVSSSCNASVSATPKWQLAYNNGSKTPAISSGTISSNSPALILSNKHAGKDGQMTAMLQTTVFKSTDPSGLGMNSGLVFRSDADASSYLIMNFLGYGEAGKARGTLKARLCKSTGKGTGNSTSNCTSKEFSPALIISPTSMIKVKMTVSGSDLDVVASVDGTEGSTSFTLTGDYDLSGEYVGMKLYDRYFTLYDIGWSSTSFLFEGETCWDVPAVYCSFKANYIGDLVPKDSNVTPWVGASSWFTEHGCALTYSYSGNDNTTSTAGNGSYVSLTSSTYNFSEQGLHGQTKQDGEEKHNDAKVSAANCSGSSSLDGTEAHCGYFKVGTVNSCSMHYDILASTANPKSGTAGDTLIINTPNQENGINIRDAALAITVQGLTAGQAITVYLKDKNGKFSLPSYINGNGTSQHNVNVMSDVEPFDPQQVVAVVMIGTSNYTVTYIHSSCDYVFDIKNCSASYNNGSWNITSTINNPGSAKAGGCTVVSDDNTINNNSNNADVVTNGVNCPSDGKFSLSDPTFYTRLNANGNQDDMTVKFTVTGVNKAEQLDTCIAIGTGHPSAITCHPDTIYKGQTFPAVHFTISNCPNGGCPYTVKYSGCNAAGCSGSGKYEGPGEATFAPDPLPNTSEMDAGEYTYMVSYLGQTENCPIKVIETVPANVTACTVGANGLVNGTVQGANWAEAPVALTIAVTDALGNVIDVDVQTVQVGAAPSSFSTDLKDLTLVPGREYQVHWHLGTGNTGACGGTNNKYTPPLSGFAITCGDNGSIVVNGETTKSLAITGCNGEPACSWEISPSNDGSTLTSSTSSVTITNAVPGTTYTLNGKRGTGDTAPTATCSVTFREAFGVTCNSHNTQDTIGNRSASSASDEISITPYDVKGCYGECSYDVTTVSGTTVYTTTPTNANSYDGGEIKFTDANGSGLTEYRLVITKSPSESKTCTFKVGYPAADAFPCTYYAKVQGGIDNQNLSVSGVPKAQYDLYIDDTSKVKWDVWSNDDGSAIGFNFATPTKLGTHTYKVTKKGETTTQCHGSFEVVNPLLCEIENEVELNVQNKFKVSVMEYKENNAQVFTCSNCTYTNVDCGYSCGGVGVNDYTFTLNSYTPKELKVTCQCNPGNKNPVCTKVAAVPHAPDIDCDALKTAVASAGAGTNVVIRPTVVGCAENCSYTIVGGHTNISHSTANWTSGTAMDALESESESSTPVSYTLTVTNDIAPYTDQCKFGITYSSVILRTVTTNLMSYEKGKTYSLSVGDNVYNGFGCNVATSSTSSRTVGSFNESDITIPSYNYWSNRVKPAANSTGNIFSVANDAPNDLECNINW